MKYKVIAFMGKSGAGKDYLSRLLAEACPNMHEIVSYTTRPPRSGEVDGVSYHFVSEKDFFEKKLLEHTKFRDWYYGTALEDLQEDTYNIGVFNPAGVRNLAANPNIELTCFLVRAPDKVRLMRQLQREANPDIKEIIRRYEADEKDFESIEEELRPIIIDSPIDDLHKILGHLL